MSCAAYDHADRIRAGLGRAPEGDEQSDKTLSPPLGMARGFTRNNVEKWKFTSLQQYLISACLLNKNTKAMLSPLYARKGGCGTRAARACTAADIFNQTRSQSVPLTRDPPSPSLLINHWFCDAPTDI